MEVAVTRLERAAQAQQLVALLAAATGATAVKIIVVIGVRVPVPVGIPVMVEMAQIAMVLVLDFLVPVAAARVANPVTPGVVV
jgi:hypothetical protein